MNTKLELLNYYDIQLHDAIMNLPDEIASELLACHEIGFDANPERMEIEMEYIYI